ncbi:unnamed protein product, partial [Musa acuminata subsp. burmannicoides]
MLISPFFFFLSLFFPHSLMLMSIAITRIFLTFVGAQIASRRRSTAGDFSGDQHSYPRGQCFYWSVEQPRCGLLQRCVQYSEIVMVDHRK